MRLQSFLSKAGVTSRRKAKEVIEKGDVFVNGEVVKEAGSHIDPSKDKVSYKKRPIKLSSKSYYLFHKPKNVVTTNKDTHGRKTVLDFFKNTKERIYPVGRLDRNTTGLIVMTNDGDLAHQLMHPSFGVVKRYVAVLENKLSPTQVTKFKSGIVLDGKKTSKCQISYHGSHKGGYAYEIALHEGRYRQIRRMTEKIGVRVKDLHRFEYGPIKLGHLPIGKHRTLTDKEVKLLKKVVSKD